MYMNMFISVFLVLRHDVSFNGVTSGFTPLHAFMRVLATWNILWQETSL